MQLRFVNHSSLRLSYTPIANMHSDFLKIAKIAQADSELFVLTATTCRCVYGFGDRYEKVLGRPCPVEHP